MMKLREILKSGDLKTIVFVLFVLIVCEFMIRGFATDLSRNIKHIETFPATVTQLSSSNKKSVVFMGNSLIGNAADQDVFIESIGRLGMHDVSAYKVVPDATAIWDWYCIAKNQLAVNNKHPDVVINGFAWWQLSDQERPEPARLGGYFCDVSDIRDLYYSGLKNKEDLIKYYLSAGSYFFTNRDLIKKRFLEKLIFAYKDSVQIINERKNHRSDIAVTNTKTYRLLEKYLSLLNGHGMETLFISMPVKDDYEVDENLVSVLQKYGARYLDYRHLDAITPDLFIDPIHLGAEGSRIFTTQLAKDYSDENLY